MPVSIRLPEELREELKRLAKADGRPLANLVQKVLADWVAAQQGAT
jgi:predicted DNA-binding protein